MTATIFALAFFTLLFLSLSAFFSASEMALFSIPRERINFFKGHKSRSLKQVYSLLEDGQRTLLLILLGNMFANITLAGLISSLLESLLNRQATGLSLLAATGIIIVFGEILPKNVALRHNEKIAALIAPLFHYLMIISAPLLKVIRKVNQVFLVRVRVHMARPSPFITVDELMSAVQSSVSEGVISRREQHVIINLLDKGAQPVKRFMLHRSQVVFLPKNTPVRKALVEMGRAGRSFLLLTQSARNQQICGIVRLPELLSSSPQIPIRQLCSDAEWVPETLEVADLISYMYENDLNEVCVLDEFGGYAGVFSLAEGLRRVMQLPKHVENAEPESTAGRTRVFSGLEEIEAMEDWITPELESYTEEVRTLNGILTRYLGRIPKTGEQFAIGGFNFYIIKSGLTRIESVLIKRGSKE